jgi:sec-independent protein translocase protein TatA
MPSLGPGEIVLIFVIIMVVFGATKLPQLGDGLGKAIKNFKRAVAPANEIEVSRKNIEPNQGTETQSTPTGDQKNPPS